VLKESDLCTVQERIASELQRKNALMKKVWDQMCGSEKVLMKQYGFGRWQRKRQPCVSVTVYLRQVCGCDRVTNQRRRDPVYSAMLTESRAVTDISAVPWS
jgi:hypothetical protein